jgi:NAD(P)-dependent dehydrogenase (short-subunit alcohol dehydrogenase family)
LPTSGSAYDDQIALARLDVNDAAAAQAAVQVAVNTFGGLDVLVNKAGFANAAPFEQMPEDDFKAQIDTNFYGVVNLTRAAIPVMREQRSGHIIKISSGAGRLGAPGHERLPCCQVRGWRLHGIGRGRSRWMRRKDHCRRTGEHSDQLGPARIAKRAQADAGL